VRRSKSSRPPCMLAYLGSRQENVNHPYALPRVTVEDFMLMPRWFGFPSPATLAESRPRLPLTRGLLDRRCRAASQFNASGPASLTPSASGGPSSTAASSSSWYAAARRWSLAGCFPLLAELYRKPVLPTGLLLPEPNNRSPGRRPSPHYV